MTHLLLVILLEPVPLVSVFESDSVFCHVHFPLSSKSVMSRANDRPSGTSFLLLSSFSKPPLF